MKTTRNKRIGILRRNHKNIFKKKRRSWYGHYIVAGRQPGDTMMRPDLNNRRIIPRLVVHEMYFFIILSFRVVSSFQEQLSNNTKKMKEKKTSFHHETFLFYSSFFFLFNFFCMGVPSNCLLLLLFWLVVSFGQVAYNWKPCVKVTNTHGIVLAT